MRINRYLASCGVASRRKCEEIILAGRVKINGKKVDNLSTDIDEEFDRVSVDGRAIHLVETYSYYKLHKPKGYISSAKDDHDRKTIMSLMRGVKKRVFPIGRLDYDSEGLILLTDDGLLANLITHPKNKIDKTYIVKIEGKIDENDKHTLENGVDIGDYQTDKAVVSILEDGENTTRLEVTIHEGKNRQIRRMFDAIGKHVIFLKRTKIGEISLGGLSRGEYKELNKHEMQYIAKLKDKKDV